MERLHHSKIIDLMQRRDTAGRLQPHDILYCKKSTGELVRYEQATLTSVHSTGDTLNIHIPGGQAIIKKLRRCLILAIDNIKIYY